MRLEELALDTTTAEVAKLGDKRNFSPFLLSYFPFPLFHSSSSCEMHVKAAPFAINSLLLKKNSYKSTGSSSKLPSALWIDFWTNFNYRIKNVKQEKSQDCLNYNVLECN